MTLRSGVQFLAPTLPRQVTGLLNLCCLSFLTGNVEINTVNHVALRRGLSPNGS